MEGRKRLRGKSNNKSGQKPKSVEVTKKRKLLPERTQEQNKRRRSERYNLRPTKSVIFVGEVPCCNTPEQRKKYAKLGLNTALFLHGSQRPKRKQSHISIITVSSDDEETSEQWTSQWVNSLVESHLPSEMEENISFTQIHQSEENTNVSSNENQQNKDERHLSGNENQQNKKFKHTTGNEDPQKIEEDDHLVVTEQPVKQQTFQPMCSSTPNTSSSFQSTTMQYQINKWNNPIECDPCTLNSAEQPTGNRQDMLNVHQEVTDLASTLTTEGTRSLFRDQIRTFEPVIPCSPTASSNVQASMQDPPQPNQFEMKIPDNPVPTNFGSDNSLSSSRLIPNHTMDTGSINLGDLQTNENPQTIASQFYFGSSTSENATNPPVSPFESYFQKCINKPGTSSGCKLPSTISNEPQGEN